jgi:hypothetical protein
MPPVGLAPINAAALNNSVGTLLSNFANIRAAVHQQQAWLAAEDLTADPYNMTPEDQTLIKSAMGPLDTALQAIDMTFISRIIGLPV